MDQADAADFPVPPDIEHWAEVLAPADPAPRYVVAAEFSRARHRKAVTGPGVDLPLEVLQEESSLLVLYVLAETSRDWRDWSELEGTPRITVLHTHPSTAGAAAVSEHRPGGAQVLVDRSATEMAFVEVGPRDVFGLPAWTMRGRVDIRRRDVRDRCGVEVCGYDLPEPPPRYARIPAAGLYEARQQLISRWGRQP